MKDIWAILGLERARWSDIGGGDDAEKQPAPLKLAFPGLDEAPSGADDWRGQEAVERIVNTILLCAVRDGASAISIEPQTQSVRVRLTVAGNVRDHLKLPMLTHQPIVARVKLLARIEKATGATPQTQSGLIRLRVDEHFYHLHVQTQLTPWGERVELHFSVVA